MVNRAAKASPPIKGGVSSFPLNSLAVGWDSERMNLAQTSPSFTEETHHEQVDLALCGAGGSRPGIDVIACFQ
jgi:hypothetical protein